MFSGIVEACVEIVSFRKKKKSAVLSLKLEKGISTLGLGDSLAVNGCCLTVSEKSRDHLSFDVMVETLNATSLGGYREGDVVNVERALKVGDQIGGHFVTGHIDTTARLLEICEGEEYTHFTFETENKFLDAMILRGSVAIDGVSLTISDLQHRNGRFTVCIIPHTRKTTLFGFYQEGCLVNLETDMFGKYIQSYLARVHDGAS
jgi:riboflavin synthase